MGARKLNDFTFRPATSDEMVVAGKQIDYAFNEEGGAMGCKAEWTIFAFDGDRLAATSGAYPFQMGFDGNTVPCAGVTIVTTEPEYRRRGLVRKMCTRLLHKAKEDGQPVAALWASMGALYQRYGYGLASNFNSYEIDPRNVVFRDEVSDNGYVRRLGADEALPLIRDVFTASIKGKTLTPEREDYFWAAMYPPRDKDKHHFAVSFDAQDRPRGFAVYKQKDERQPDGTHALILTIDDFIWLDLAGYQALWTFLRSHDLANMLRFYFVPDDDPAPQTLLEPRKLGKRQSDGIWMRVVDVPALLEQRGYSLGGSATVTIEDDDLCPWNNGTWTVNADGGGAPAKVSEGGDAGRALKLSINTLATVLSGHTGASQLSAMGKIQCCDSAALRAADALFSTTHRPWCPHEF